jgi:hypothetical protein
MCRITTQPSSMSVRPAVLWHRRSSASEWASASELSSSTIIPGDGAVGDGTGEAAASTTTVVRGVAGTVAIVRPTTGIAHDLSYGIVVPATVATGVIVRPTIVRQAPATVPATTGPEASNPDIVPATAPDTHRAIAPEEERLAIGQDITQAIVREEHRAIPEEPQATAPDIPQAIVLEEHQAIPRATVPETEIVQASSQVNPAHHRLAQLHKIDQLHRIVQLRKTGQLHKIVPHRKTGHHNLREGAVLREVVLKVVSRGSHARSGE